MSRISPIGLSFSSTQYTSGPRINATRPRLFETRGWLTIRRTGIGRLSRTTSPAFQTRRSVRYCPGVVSAAGIDSPLTVPLAPVAQSGIRTCSVKSPASSTPVTSIATSPSHGYRVSTRRSTDPPPGSGTDISPAANWWIQTRSCRASDSGNRRELTVTAYPGSWAMNRAAFGGQQPHSNHGCRRCVPSSRNGFW